MTLGAIRTRMTCVYNTMSRTREQLVALEALDPHSALGVSGRRLQRTIEECRDEIDRLRDMAVVTRQLDRVA